MKNKEMKKIKKIMVVYYSRNYGTLAKVKKAVKRNGVAATYVVRENEAEIKRRVSGVDAVIVVGGDGTLLRASHFVENTPVLHVSSSVNKNEAFFARATGNEFERKIRLLMKGVYKIIPLMRLEATLNRGKLPFKALNEIYVGSKEPYHVARYKLVIGGRMEEQKSSGIIISTPAGSYAWAKSAGGRTLPLTAKKILYVVREPYIGRLTKPRMLQGVLGPNGKIAVVSNIWEKRRGLVVIDSYKKEFEFNKGDRLVVKAAKQPLNLISF